MTILVFTDDLKIVTIFKLSGPISYDVHVIQSMNAIHFLLNDKFLFSMYPQYMYFLFRFRDNLNGTRPGKDNFEKTKFISR